jgi:hypothetical protein
MTDIYLRLDYRQYKHLEAQLRAWAEIETSHTTVDGFYHRALRLEIGDVTLEIQGPAVKEPLRDPEPVENLVGVLNPPDRRRPKDAAGPQEVTRPPLAFGYQTAAEANEALDAWWREHLAGHHDQARRRGLPDR